MKKLIVFSLAVVLLTGLFGMSAAVAAKKGPRNNVCRNCGMGSQQDGFMIQNLKMLGLDDNQMEEIRNIHVAARKDTVKKRADLEVAQLELRDIMRKDAVDVNSAEAKVKQIEAMKSDIKMIHIKALAEVKTKLNPEQRKKFNDMTRDRKPGMGSRRSGNVR